MPSSRTRRVTPSTVTARSTSTEPAWACRATLVSASPSTASRSMTTSPVRSATGPVARSAGRKPRTTARPSVTPRMRADAGSAPAAPRGGGGGGGGGAAGAPPAGRRSVLTGGGPPAVGRPGHRNGLDERPDVLAVFVHRPAVRGGQPRHQWQAHAAGRGVATAGRDRGAVGCGVGDIEQPPGGNRGEEHAHRWPAVSQPVGREFLEDQQQPVEAVGVVVLLGSTPDRGLHLTAKPGEVGGRPGGALPPDAEIRDRFRRSLRPLRGDHLCVPRVVSWLDTRGRPASLGRRSLRT